MGFVASFGLVNSQQKDSPIPFEQRQPFPLPIFASPLRVYKRNIHLFKYSTKASSFDAEAFISTTKQRLLVNLNIP